MVADRSGTRAYFGNKSNTTEIKVTNAISDYERAMAERIWPIRSGHKGRGVHAQINGGFRRVHEGDMKFQRGGWLAVGFEI